MTALVDGLEAEGLVVRRPHPTDRRATMVEVTTDGDAAAEAILEPAMGAMSCLFADLTEDQQQQFSEALLTLKRGMMRRASKS
jgi:DNA-binding MarR family transcriptional regulator